MFWNFHVSKHISIINEAHTGFFFWSLFDFSNYLASVNNVAYSSAFSKANLIIWHLFFHVGFKLHWMM